MRGRFDTTDTAGDFSHLRDHRRAAGKLYPLPQILVFCLLAMLAGASSYRKMHEFIMVHFRRGSYWVPGWWDASPDQASDEGAEQGFAATAGVMHELKE